MAKATRAPRKGQGVLVLGAQTYQVKFNFRLSYEYDGRRSTKGSLSGAPDAMREAFHKVHARLILDDGEPLLVTIVAHAQGSPICYFVTEGELSWRRLCTAGQRPFRFKPGIDND